MDDQAFPNKSSDDQQASDTQDRVDGVLNNLPDDLEKPVETTTEAPKPDLPTSPASTPTEPEPTTTPTTNPPDLPPLPSTPLATPTQVEPEMPEVKVEEPMGMKPSDKKKMGRAVKIGGGLLMLAILVGGGLYGGKMMKYRQVVNSQAWEEGDAKIVGKTLYVYEGGRVRSYVAGGEAANNVTVTKKDKDGNDEAQTINWNKTHNQLENLQQAGTLDDSLINSKGNIGTDNVTTVDDIKTSVGNNVKEYNAAVGNAEKKCRDAAPQYYDECFVGAMRVSGFRGYINTQGTIGEGTCEFWSGVDTNKPGEDGYEEIDKDDGATLSMVDCQTYLKKLQNGDICGQLDQIVGGKVKNFYVFYDPVVCDGKKEKEEPPGSPPPSTPPGSPTPSYSCVSLSGDETYEYGTTETFSCEANFSAVNPVAFFRYNVDGGAYNTSPVVSLSGTTATYDIPIDEYGVWEVQCRVCTDSTATDCTEWGDAN